MEKIEDEIVIEEVYPSVDGGKIPAKGCTGLVQYVSCKAYSHGTKIIGAQVDFKPPGSKFLSHSASVLPAIWRK